MPSSRGWAGALWEFVGMVQSAPGEYAEAIGRALFGAGMPDMRGY